MICDYLTTVFSTGLIIIIIQLTRVQKRVCPNFQPENVMQLFALLLPMCVCVFLSRRSGIVK